MTYRRVNPAGEETIDLRSSQAPGNGRSVVNRLPQAQLNHGSARPRHGEASMDRWLQLRRSCRPLSKA